VLLLYLYDFHMLRGAQLQYIIDYIREASL